MNLGKSSHCHSEIDHDYDEQRHFADLLTKPDVSRSAHFGTDSVTSGGDKQAYSEAKHRVERPRVKLLGWLDWIDPLQSIPGN